MKCPHCGKPIDLSKNLEGFDAFWDSYPRKIGKGQARKAYGVALTKTTADDLLRASQAYTKSRVGKEKQYTLHPSTFLSGEHYLDDEIISVKMDLLEPHIKRGFHPSWSDYRDKLVIRIGVGQFEAWFSETEVQMPDGKFEPVTLIAPSPLKKQWIETKFASDLHDVLGTFQVVLR